MNTTGTSGLVLAGGLFAFLAIGVGALVQLFVLLRRRRRERQIVARIERPDQVRRETEEAQAVQSIFRDTSRDKKASRWDRLPFVGKIRKAFEQSGADQSFERFLMKTAGMAALAGLLLTIVTGSLMIGAVVTVLVGAAPSVRLSMVRRRRLAHFEEQFPEALDLMIRALKAGNTQSAALQIVGEEGPNPVAGEFRQMCDEMQFGVPYEEALRRLAARVDTIDVRIFATAMLIQHEIGSELAPVLENIAGTIRDRFSLRRHIKAQTAQGRATGVLLTIMPPAVGGLLYLVAPSVMRILITDPRGHMMIAAAVGLEVVGTLIVRRILKADV